MAPTVEQQLKAKIIETLELKITPEKIDENAPLFREGLGLDSIDALELVEMLSEHFHVDLGDNPQAKEVLRSVRTMADYVRQHAAP